MSDSKGLSLICKAAQMLAEAKTIEDFKKVRDVGEAAVRFVKSRMDYGLEAVLNGQEIVRRAERHMGALLPGIVKKGGNRAKLQDATLLGDIGIEKTQSSRFQKIAQLPDDEFEAWIAACRDTGDEMTQASALRLAASAMADPVEKPEQPAHEEMAAAVKNAVTKFVGKLTTPEQFLYVRRRLERMLEFLSEMEAEHGVGRSGKKTTRASAG